MNFRSIPDVIAHPGLRIVVIQGMPSPWSQAARAVFEYKGLDYVAAPYVIGASNEELVAWSGQNSAPVVAYANEPPIHRFMDILLLAERLAPKPALLPEDPEERIRVVGLCHEVSGDLGLGWWGRLVSFHAMMTSGAAPPALVGIAKKWGYTEERGTRAPRELVTRLAALGAQAKANRERGSRFLVGDSLSVLDLHWAAMSVLFSPLPPETMPVLEAFRGGLGVVGAIPEIAAALDPVLIEHRDFVIDQYFTTPFDYD